MDKRHRKRIKRGEKGNAEVRERMGRQNGRDVRPHETLV